MKLRSIEASIQRSLGPDLESGAIVDENLGCEDIGIALHVAPDFLVPMPWPRCDEVA